MQLEIRVKRSKRSSVKKRSTEFICCLELASSLRLVGWEAKFFQFSCKFILIGIFGFRKGKEVNPLELAEIYLLSRDGVKFEVSW